MVAFAKAHQKTLTPYRSAKDSGRRFYSPEISRWLSRDPIGEDGGLNVYAFVLNDVCNRTDGWGLSWNWIDGKGAGGALNDAAEAQATKQYCLTEMVQLVASVIQVDIPYENYSYVWRTYDHGAGEWKDNLVDFNTFWTQLLDEQYKFIPTEMKSLAQEVDVVSAIVMAHENAWDRSVYSYHTWHPPPGYTAYIGPPYTTKSSAEVNTALAAVMPTKGTFVASTCVPGPGGTWAQRWAVKGIEKSCVWTHVFSADNEGCKITWNAGSITKVKE